MSITDTNLDIITAVEAMTQDFFKSGNRTDKAVRDLAACLHAVDIVGVRDQLTAATLQASDPDTASVAELNTFIKAVQYRLYVKTGAYAPGGAFYYAPKKAITKRPARTKTPTLVAA